jgi:hypothetical protein
VTGAAPETAVIGAAGKAPGVLRPSASFLWAAPPTTASCGSFQGPNVVVEGGVAVVAVVAVVVIVAVVGCGVASVTSEGGSAQRGRFGGDDSEATDSRDAEGC